MSPGVRQRGVFPGFLAAGLCAAALLGAAAFVSASGAAVLPAGYARFSVRTPPGPAVPSPAVFRAVPRLVHTRHQVAKGENIRSIAAAYGTDVRSLQSTNSNEFIFLSRGGYIRVHNGRGFLYEVTAKGETLNGLAARYAKGRDLRAFKGQIVEENGLPPSALLVNHKFAKGDRVFLPGVYVDLDTYRLPLRSFSRVSSRFGVRYHPVLKRRIMHKGTDIPMPYGTPVYPSRSGTVSFAGQKGGYGNLVEVTHKDGSRCRYGHLQQINVQEGATVQKSRTLLGKVGSSGMSTGPHLHFEIISPSGRQVNPMAKIGKR